MGAVGLAPAWNWRRGSSTCGGGAGGAGHAEADGRPQLSNIAYSLGDDGVIRISVTADRAKTRNAGGTGGSRCTSRRTTSGVLRRDRGDAEVLPTAAAPTTPPSTSSSSSTGRSGGSTRTGTKYRQAMVADRRLVLRIRPTTPTGWPERRRASTTIDALGVTTHGLRPNSIDGRGEPWATTGTRADGGGARRGRRLLRRAGTVPQALVRRGHHLVVGDPAEGLVEELEARGAQVEVVTGVRNLADRVGPEAGRCGPGALRSHRCGGRCLGPDRDRPVRELEPRRPPTRSSAAASRRRTTSSRRPSPHGRGRRWPDPWSSPAPSAARPTPGRPSTARLGRGDDARATSPTRWPARTGVQVNAVGTNFMDFPSSCGRPGHRPREVRARVESPGAPCAGSAPWRFAAFCMPFIDGTSGFTTGHWVAYAGAGPDPHGLGQLGGPDRLAPRPRGRPRRLAARGAGSGATAVGAGRGATSSTWVPSGSTSCSEWLPSSSRPAGVPDPQLVEPGDPGVEGWPGPRAPLKATWSSRSPCPTLGTGGGTMTKRGGPVAQGDHRVAVLVEHLGGPARWSTTPGRRRRRRRRELEGGTPVTGAGTAGRSSGTTRVSPQPAPRLSTPSSPGEWGGRVSRAVPGGDRGWGRWWGRRCRRSPGRARRRAPG